MPSIPSNLSRAPNLLTSQVLASQINRTNVSLLQVQSQLASGRSVERMSDNAVRATTIATLDDHLERREQRLTNLDAAGDTLDFLDSTLGDAVDLLREAKAIASSQIGVGSDAQTRRNQAVVIESMIAQLANLANRETRGVYLFGGSSVTRPPLVGVSGGYRYVGEGQGLFNDINIGERIPMTLGGDNAIGETSVRLQSSRDLNPALTGDTRLASLVGGRGLGVALGTINFSFDGGPLQSVDLSQADTVQNVADSITSVIRTYEAENGVAMLGPGGVSVSSGGISIDVVAGPPDPELRFSDVGAGVTAADLGLAAAPFSATNANGGDLNPRLTMQSPVSSLGGVTIPLEKIRISMVHSTGASSVDVDLTTAQTIDDVRRLIEDAAPGVRVRINDAGTGINLYNEVAGPGLSVQEVPGGADTATELGIRSYNAQTRLTEFNDGRGVRIIDGSTDPVTGLPSPELDVDFVIHLGNGDKFTVDLRPQDIVNVESLIARVNEEAATAEANGDIPTGSFRAELTDGANGIALRDLQGLGPIVIEKKNNSPAADDLGLSSGQYDATSATFMAQDRATVRVQNILTSLIDLRDALRNNDSDGITLAGSQLDQHLDRVTATHALVGVYAQRVDLAKAREENLSLQDQSMKSQLQDVDFTEASIRYSTLRTQLQASLTVGGQSQTQTLLDFLG